MEFLRLGSSIPGSMWGCCAVDVIQDFKQHPDDKASIQIVNGDEGTPIQHPKGGFMYAGPTYGDIFKQRIRCGTFSSRDLPNHAFIAVLTASQLSYTNGKAWLKILKEEGFEFIRAVDNSVYTGAKTLDEPGKFTSTQSHINYIFGLFRNIGKGALRNPYQPPEEWLELEPVVSSDTLEVWQALAEEAERLTIEYQTYHLDRWHSNPAPPFLTEQEVIDAGATVTYAGLRSKFPQQSKTAREAEEANLKKAGGSSSSAFPSAMATAVPEYVEIEDDDYYDEPCDCDLCT